MDSIWTRQPCDDDRSWPAFVEYRDQSPPRKLRPVFDGGLIQTRAWYIDNAWRDRVAAYDTWRDKIVLEEREAILRQSSKAVAAEHMRLAKDLRSVALAETEKFLDAVSKTPMSTVRPRELVSMIEAVVKVDRLIRGETTEKIEQSIDLSKFSMEEIVAWHKLLAKAEMKP